MPLSFFGALMATLVADGIILGITIEVLLWALPAKIREEIEKSNFRTLRADKIVAKEIYAEKSASIGVSSED